MILSTKSDVEKFYCFKCNKCIKFKNPKTPYVWIKCGSNDNKIFKEEESIKLLKTLGLINNNDMIMVVIMIIIKLK